MPADTARSYLAPHKSPSRQSISLRKSSASLRGLPDENAPSAGSRLLAEEFGIEYDEGAEGIDSDPHAAEGNPEIAVDEPSFADHSFDGPHDDTVSEGATESQDMDPNLASRHHCTKGPRAPEQDPMQVLSQNLEFTDKFLVHLRTVDSTDANPLQHQSTLERLAGDVIRRLEETVRDREGQVRELLEYEREFRKIAGENDIADEVEADAPATSPTTSRAPRMEDSLRHARAPSSDWDADEPSPSSSPTVPTFQIPPPPPAPSGPPTPAMTLPHLTHIRALTTSLVTSLTTISEQAQVTGAATTDAGRRIRALKNKLGGWRTEWEAAERSRIKIEKWEQESTRSGAFELALKDAGLKTDAIMAAS
ncbi:hypothetical protein BD626DRAFT_546741 [Schizophyllum amplum]|uniref:Uncharacterized protein n=1 Tax=Schizophyllum amplum TaxID=97359 RepID=A0A550CK46_9AGAR|nr:hypothetical protein BD626DRAFT_546741 [Auriculariopsis ampla]